MNKIYQVGNITKRFLFSNLLKKIFIFQSFFTGDKYLKFIREINYKNKGRHLLMDNASIHHTKKLKEYINKKNFNVIYNIPKEFAEDKF